MDLSSVVLSFQNATLSVERSPRATYESGDPVVDSDEVETLSAPATVQPATGRDLKRVPEGLRTEDGIVAFTAVELLTASATNEPDLVTYRGEVYQVAKVERWDDSGAYWRSICTKVGAR